MRHLRKNARSSPLRERSVRKGRRNRNPLFSERLSAWPGKSHCAIFEYGIPVEYELVRSINTVASGKRKRIMWFRVMPDGGYVMNQTVIETIPRHVLIKNLLDNTAAKDLSGPVAPGLTMHLVVQPSSSNPLVPKTCRSGPSRCPCCDL